MMRYDPLAEVLRQQWERLVPSEEPNTRFPGDWLDDLPVYGRDEEDPDDDEDEDEEDEDEWDSD
jgi:hypothetical protein